MKKYFVFFAYLILTISLTILFAIVHSTIFAKYAYPKEQAQIKEVKQISTCNVYFATQDFVAFIQDKSQENPDKFEQKHEDFEKLAEEIEILTEQGDDDAICDKYKEFMIKF